MKKIEFIKRNGKLHWGGVASLPLEPTDIYGYSPSEKLIFIASVLDNKDTVVAVYDLKSRKKGFYEYKDCVAQRLFQYKGCCAMIYRYNDKNGVNEWYQGKLLDNGYITDIVALHREKDGKILHFIEEEMEKSEEKEPEESKKE